MIKRILLCSVIPVIMSCGGASNSVEKSNNEKAGLEPFYCDEIAEMEELELKDNETYSRTTILSYELVNNCICIKYQYSGCVEGERLLAWDGTHNQGNRPEVMMHLLVKDAGQCDQVLTDSSCFSMMRMQLVGNEVLVFLNDKQKNFLLDFNTLPEERKD